MSQNFYAVVFADNKSERDEQLKGNQKVSCSEQVCGQCKNENSMLTFFSALVDIETTSRAMSSHPSSYAECG